MDIKLSAVAAIAVSAVMSTAVLADAAPRPREVEPPATTTELSIGGETLTFDGSATRRDPSDTHVITLANDSSVVIGVTTPPSKKKKSPEWTVRVMDDNGVQVASESGRDDLLLLTTLPSGTHVIEISGTSGDYQLQATAQDAFNL